MENLPEFLEVADRNEFDWFGESKDNFIKITKDNRLLFEGKNHYSLADLVCNESFLISMTLAIEEKNPMFGGGIDPEILQKKLNDYLTNMSRSIPPTVEGFNDICKCFYTWGV